MHRLLISNARHASMDGPDDVFVIVVDGRISEIGRGEASGDFDEVLDAAGRILAPGFIDVHIHGAGGGDALIGTDDDLERMSRALARMGTTGFLATTFADPVSGHRHLRNLAKLTGTDLGGAHLLGIHMEGPFINVKRKGGIPPEVIYPSSLEAVDDILEAAGDALRLMTIAPELPGNLEVIRRLAREGTVPSVGHTDATYVETLRGFEAGVRHATHLYNALPGLHHREPGPILAIFENDDISTELIADGVHIGRDMIRWTAGMLGSERCVCVTDGIHGTGLPEGRYEFNGRPYESRGGTARYLDGGLIGTTLGLGEILRRFVSWTGMPLADALRTVSLNPARLLGIDDRKGSIEIGKDADLVILDDDLRVQATVVGGRIIFDARVESETVR